MDFRFCVSAKLTALIFIPFIGAVPASAQQPQPSSPDIPTLRQDATTAPKPATAAPTAAATIRPVVPPPALVVATNQEAAARAQVLPPAPRLVTQTAGAIVIPSSLFGSGYSSANASTSTLKINSRYGYRRDPFTRRGRMHTGIDVKATWGETVGTPVAGTVEFAGVKRGYGKVVIVGHGNGISTYYAHLSSIAVTVGQTLAAGQILGNIGSTGRSTSPHLHYEVRANGRPVNPFATIAFEGGIVTVDGRPLKAPAVEGWGDEPETPAVAAAADPAARPRRATNPAIEKHTLVYGENSLTEY